MRDKLVFTVDLPIISTVNLLLASDLSVTPQAKERASTCSPPSGFILRVCSHAPAAPFELGTVDMSVSVSVSASLPARSNAVEPVNAMFVLLKSLSLIIYVCTFFLCLLVLLHTRQHVCSRVGRSAVSSLLWMHHRLYGHLGRRRLHANVCEISHPQEDWL